MRVPLSLCAAALIGAVALISPIQAHADVTIIIQTDDRNYAAPNGRGKVYVTPNGRSKVYYGGPNDYDAPYGPQRVYVAPNGRAPEYYGAPNGGRNVYVEPDGREQIDVAPYGPQKVYVGPNGPDQSYGVRAPVMVYDDRPAPWTREWYGYCTSKYRSFDPVSGTFQPYHGPRQLCR